MLMTTRKCLLEMVRRATHLSVISFNTGVKDYTLASFSILCMFMYCAVLRRRKKNIHTKDCSNRHISGFQRGSNNDNLQRRGDLDRFVLFHVLFSCVLACAVPSLLPHLLRFQCRSCRRCAVVLYVNSRGPLRPRPVQSKCERCDRTPVPWCCSCILLSCTENCSLTFFFLIREIFHKMAAGYVQCWMGL